MSSSRLLALVRAEGDEHADVLDAALSAFLDFGIRRTSMSEIARRAGISPATLYRRFAQKAEIVQAVGLREVRRFLDSVDTEVDPEASGEEQVVTLFVAFLGGLRRNKLLARLIATEPESVLPALTVQGAPVLGLGRDYLVGVIERLQRAGLAEEFDPLPLAEMLARVALSLALTPETVLPLRDDAKARDFARRHIAVAYRLT
ncbi:helix-turn-helix domain-containing protein [Jatrophihabitans sp.]|uniref:TetR/AcrR family transcriptional regulator n=1 Tax=Jatrophihabitans sp. TaxID=1932789 RepID=UPI0030C78197|nr:TetR family transcriptional regulator [Jatrophihabitans sp.]